MKENGIYVWTKSMQFALEEYTKQYNIKNKMTSKELAEHFMFYQAHKKSKDRQSVKKYKRAAVKYFKDREFYDAEYYITINGKEKEYKLSDLMADFISTYNDGSKGKFVLTVTPNEVKK